MASSSSKPTGVHFALVFFVMTTLILALVCYLVSKDAIAAKAARVDADAKATAAVSDRTNAIKDITALKDGLGYNNEIVGASGDTNNTTLIGQLIADLVKFAGEQAMPNAQAPNVRATLGAIRAKLDSVSAENQQLRANITTLRAELAAEKVNYADKLAAIQKSQNDSELALQGNTSRRQEEKAKADQDLRAKDGELRRVQRELATLQDQFDQFKLKTATNEGQMLITLQDKNRQIAAIENLSFDHADGSIVRVDNTSRTVWIDKGSDDGMREQVSFSVYVKNNQGVGRGKADIKAKIEVTEIRDRHLSTARIVQEDFDRPIQTGDPIYSPVWEKGSKEYFSIVGVVDLDGDGKTDFELLRTILQNSGAGVEVFIDENGVRNPPNGKLTTKTKFLVVGELEDPTNFPTMDATKQEQIRKVAEEAKALDQEALSRGIRVVNIRDFLNYMGYETQQNLFIKGEPGKFILQQGAQSTKVNEPVIRSRFSEGITSERFSPENLKKFGSGTP